MDFSSHTMRVVQLFVAVAMLLAGSVAGQELPENAAFSLLRSETQIRGELVTSNGVAFQFTTRDGEFLRISEEGAEYDLAVAFVLEPVEDAYSEKAVFDHERMAPQIKLAELEIRQHPSGGGEAVNFRAENVPIEIGASHYLTDGHEIRVDQVGKLAPGIGKKIDVTRLQAKQPVSEKNICCITCGGVTACGCSISASCGSCCSGSCCGGGVGGFNEN